MHSYLMDGPPPPYPTPKPQRPPRRRLGGGGVLDRNRRRLRGGVTGDGAGGGGGGGEGGREAHPLGTGCPRRSRSSSTPSGDMVPGGGAPRGEGRAAMLAAAAAPQDKSKMAYVMQKTHSQNKLTKTKTHSLRETHSYMFSSRLHVCFGLILPRLQTPCSA